MVRTQFKANQVGGFNPGYYLGKNPDVGANFDHWFSQQPMNFGKYVKGTPHIEASWRGDYANHPVTLATGNPPESRVSWGEKHWNKWGKAGGDPMAYNVGDNYYLMSKGANDQSAKNDFAAWHFDRYGRNEGRFGNENAWYMSPEQQGIRDAEVAAQLQEIAAQEAEAMQAAAEGAEAGRLASRRGGGSQTLGASGAATFKGKGLTSSENKRGKGRGTGQFKRPYGASNLSIAATGKGNQQSTLNL